MDVVAHRFAHEAFRHAKPLRQLPQLGTAFGHRVVQVGYRHQVPHRPLIRLVLVPAAAVHGGVDVVKAAGDAVPQLMAQMHPLLHPAVLHPAVHADVTFAALQHDAHGTGLLHGVIQHLYILF